MLMAIIRAIFVLVVGGLAARLAKLAGDHNVTAPQSVPWIFIAAMLAAIAVVLGDMLTPRKKVQTISGIYFGLIVGLILSGLLQVAIEPSLTLLLGTDRPWLAQSIIGILTVIICYVTVSTILQTKDDFRFIVPYMEFSRDVKGTRPLILDTSVIIDGRIADVAEARILDQPMIVPRFVLQELHGIADSSDKLRRNRGRRGLDVLNRLQKMKECEVQIHDGELPEMEGVREVDQKLVILSKHLGGKVVTNDYNLNKIAKLQGVEVINLNDVANALKPIVLPGESLTVKLIKRGEEPGQGVGYLDDGTMVVAEHGVHHLGEITRLTVTSVLQTSAGRMIFGRLDLPGQSQGAAQSGPVRRTESTAGVSAGVNPNTVTPDPAAPRGHGFDRPSTERSGSGTH
jgi:uncharacterized protein YacL